MTTNNTFTMQGWQEEIVSGAENQPRFAHAHATFGYAGVIEGTSVCDYLLYYAGEGFDGQGTTSPGLERIEGSVDGKKGSFVTRHEVGFSGHDIAGKWTVLPGSGTDELAGLTGSGTISGSSATMNYEFEYTLE